MTNPEQILPPGFRFHPTDEELILHYLKNKATSLPCPVSIIAEVDIYKSDPWDLPAKATFGDREWYFFSPRDRKYPNGIRPNRAAGSGYWKATGTDKPISTVRGLGKKENIGVKKALVFYRGKPPKGTKTNWIMHEYRLVESGGYTNQHVHRSFTPLKQKDSSMRLDDWVLCRIYEKSNHHPVQGSDHHRAFDSNVEDAFLYGLPQTSHQSELKLPKCGSLSDFFATDADYTMLSRILNDNPFDMGGGQEQLGSHLTIHSNPCNSYMPSANPSVDPLKRQRSPDGFPEQGSSSKRYCSDVDDTPCVITAFSNQLQTPLFGSISQSYPNHQMLLMNSHLQHH